MVTLLCGMRQRFYSGVNSDTKKEINFHFIMIIASIILFVAMSSLMYNGFVTWIIERNNDMDKMWLALVGRTCLCMLSFGLMWIGNNYNPFDVDDKKKKL